MLTFNLVLLVLTTINKKKLQGDEIYKSLPSILIRETYSKKEVVFMMVYRDVDRSQMRATIALVSWSFILICTIL